MSWQSITLKASLVFFPLLAFRIKTIFFLKMRREENSFHIILVRDVRILWVHLNLRAFMPAGLLSSYRFASKFLSFKCSSPQEKADP